MKNVNKPLVSVVVVTYNSASHVVETLDSVKAQTYERLELVITDDHSSDDTVEICRNWINQNRHRFVDVKVIASESNTGITPNRNRGCFAAEGAWIKQIDGDDKLKPHCIADYVTFASSHEDKNIIFSPLDPFGQGDLEEWRNLLRSNFSYAFSLSKKDFRILLCKCCLFPAPSAFIKKSFFVEVGGYDESIKFLEDWPFWVRTAFSGAHFAYIPTSEVEYRISPTSLSQGVGGKNTLFEEAIRLTKKKTISFMRKVSILYSLEGYLAYQAEYNSKPIWKMLAYLRPLNPYFWKARKLYRNYITTADDER